MWKDLLHQDRDVAGILVDAVSNLANDVSTQICLAHVLYATPQLPWMCKRKSPSVQRKPSRILELIKNNFENDSTTEHKLLPE